MRNIVISEDAFNGIMNSLSEVLVLHSAKYFKGDAVLTYDELVKSINESHDKLTDLIKMIKTSSNTITFATGNREEAPKEEADSKLESIIDDVEEAYHTFNSADMFINCNGKFVNKDKEELDQLRILEGIAYIEGKLKRVLGITDKIQD